MSAVLIRRETPADVDAIRTVAEVAFGPRYAPDPAPEPALVDQLRADTGDPGYYRRFGFGPAQELGVLAPAAQWGVHFQARPLTGYDPAMRGVFTYAEPFGRL